MQPVRPNLTRLIGSGCQLVFGSIWLLFSLVFLLVAWFAGAPWYFLMFTLPFLTIGIGLVSHSLWTLLLRPGLIGRSFGPPLASLSSQQLRVGETVTVRYEQTVKREFEISRVAVRLVLRETARYQRGTSSHTATHDTIADVYESPGRRLRPGELISEACVLMVPSDGMHSFAGARNSLTWLVSISVESPMSPDVAEEIGVVVLPEVVPEGNDAGPV